MIGCFGVRVIVAAAATLFQLTFARTSAAAEATEVAFNFKAAKGDARKWLDQQGFDFLRDAKNDDRGRNVKYGFGDKGLTIDTQRRAAPILSLRSVPDKADPNRRNRLSIPSATLTISWGVNLYPRGADWSRGVNREAIMVSALFGENRPSGAIFLPPAPYFIGFFLCESGDPAAILTGRSYKEQGRYRCVETPKAGERVLSVLDLDKEFKAAFPGARMSPVTGLAIEADTTDLSGDGRATAWIETLRIAPRN